MAGVRRIGLDFGQVLAALQLNGLPRRDWRGITEGLLEMEDETLALLSTR